MVIFMNVREMYKTYVYGAKYFKNVYFKIRKCY